MQFLPPNYIHFRGHFMLDKRCHHKVRELSQFYLFIKHKKIYYAYYPMLGITRSTGCTNIHEAYIKAWEILDGLENKVNKKLYLPVKNKSDQYKLNKMLSYIDQTKPLTSSTIKKLQSTYLAAGLSGKTINNYICILRKSYQLPFPEWHCIEHTPQYRKCFPVKSFYGFWKKCQNKYHYLAFFAMTTGCRLGEIMTAEPVITEERTYLKINGTKTANAVRTIPVLQETLDCLEYIKASTLAPKQSVIEAGKLCGFDEDYIEENRIVFHSFRKLYKTLLESCNIPETFISYYMGHSQTSKVQQLYFIGSSADDSEVYPKVIEALNRFL